ncbi:universal stress protein [Rhodoflexus caldus]|uniref:universal stress protein n=1 Tax=Rhodoflexus caldus TaxID=2891236 RepID=UPI002029C640|nr:universal stress protein [Rhodoflexus caldus]
MKTILVPTDFSDNALKAMQYAIRFANTTGSHLVFFRATDTIVPETAPVHLYHELVKSDIEENMEELRKQVAQAYTASGITPATDSYSLAVEYGAFKNMIHVVIEKHQADMIIMGTQGASGLKKVFFGSNTAGLFAQVSIPVLAVPADTPADSITKIGYASDLTDFGDELAKIVAFAKPFHATIDLFHVYPVYPQLVDVTKFDKEKTLHMLTSKFDYDKLHITFVHTEYDNDIVAGIQQYVAEEKPSLLVMFTHERSWFDKLFNPSISQSVAFGTRTPLLVFKK